MFHITQLSNLLAITIWLTRQDLYTNTIYSNICVMTNSERKTVYYMKCWYRKCTIATASKTTKHIETITNQISGDNSPCLSHTNSYWTPFSAQLSLSQISMRTPFSAQLWLSRIRWQKFNYFIVNYPITGIVV